MDAVTETPLILLRVEIELCERSFDARIFRGELGAHEAELLSRTDHTSVGFRAEHEINGIEDDRFSRARLAGQHVEPLRKFDFRALDERDVLYKQAF